MIFHRNGSAWLVDEFGALHLVVDLDEFPSLRFIARSFGGYDWIRWSGIDV